MKIGLKILLILSLIIVNFSSASANKTKNQIFKELAVTTTQVEKDFGVKINKWLDDYFIKARYYKNKSELIELEKKIEPILVKYKNKSYLNRKERKEFNILQNIYYRSKILTLYYIK